MCFTVFVNVILVIVYKTLFIFTAVIYMCVLIFWCILYIFGNIHVLFANVRKDIWLFVNVRTTPICFCTISYTSLNVRAFRTNNLFVGHVWKQTMLCCTCLDKSMCFRRSPGKQSLSCGAIIYTYILYYIILYQII